MLDIAQAGDIIIEALTVLAFLSSIMVLQYFLHKVPDNHILPGWNKIRAGFAMLLLAAIMDLVDEFDFQIPLMILDTPIMEWIEEVLGHMLGGILLTLGLIQLIPSELTRITAERNLEKKTHDLAERVKELNGLYSMSEVFNTHAIRIDHALEKAVRLLPAAWHYPDITCARIIIDGREFTTDNFRETEWKQSCNIAVKDGQEGVIEVFYLEERPDIDEGPFLAEERKLINDMASKIAMFVERRKMEEYLRSAKVEAEVANVAKSEFLAAMSHDIRTPMNAILGMGEMLAESDLNPDQQHYIKIINHAGEGLLALINDILDLSKIEAGELALDSITFNPRYVVENTLEIFKLKALGKGVGLDHDFDSSVPELIVGDDQRIKQILLNLISNAIKFTERGKVVVSLLRSTDNMLRFSISDTGIGITEERLQAIFQPFKQAEASTTRRFGGTGLGLSICKKLVEHMGGRIWVVSKIGHGSTFNIEIPCQEPIAAEPKPASDLELPGTVAKPQAGFSILLADDARDNRMVVEAFLKNTDYALTIVEDGHEALQAFKQSGFDLILMDINMDQMDGYEATRLIREYERSQNKTPVPILALTANAMKGDIDKSRAAGCNLHLSKPISKKRLLECIAQFV